MHHPQKHHSPHHYQRHPKPCLVQVLIVDVEEGVGCVVVEIIFLMLEINDSFGRPKNSFGQI